MLAFLIRLDNINRKNWTVSFFPAEDLYTFSVNCLFAADRALKAFWTAFNAKSQSEFMTLPVTLAVEGSQFVELKEKKNKQCHFVESVRYKPSLHS